MLSEKAFKEGLKKLVTEYGDRGFSMTKERATQWYKFMQNMSDKEFQKKINSCLLYCNHVPFMADIMNPVKKEEVKANAGAYDYV